MFKLLGGLRTYLKYQDIVIDCAIFRLHNLFTTALLMACSLIITASQYVGNPIQCIVSGVQVHVVNTFCWISSTFTMPDAYRRQVITNSSLTHHFPPFSPSPIIYQYYSVYTEKQTYDQKFTL